MTLAAMPGSHNSDFTQKQKNTLSSLVSKVTSAFFAATLSMADLAHAATLNVAE